MKCPFYAFGCTIVFVEQITVEGPSPISVSQSLSVTGHSHDNSDKESCYLATSRSCNLTLYPISINFLIFYPSNLRAFNSAHNYIYITLAKASRE